ncbi:MAG: TonB-dependent receptor [Candidatus Omnitrophica bacterium]|nr:TonB-dependent receptor [Candidatus Omnitrophota bacterium]
MEVGRWRKAWKAGIGIAVVAAAVVDARAGTEKMFDLGEVLVTATRTETYSAQVGAATTVLDADALRRSGKTSVVEVLRDIPGVSITQNGAQGGVAYVQMRGAKSGHTLVLIDGMEVNDPTNIDRSFDFAHLTLDNVERIEIVRGPQSTLYGSDAIGGVIQIITKKGAGDPAIGVSAEAGSHRTFRESAAVRGAAGVFDYAVAASREDSAGISKASGGSEEDNYRNITVSSRAGVSLAEAGTVTLFNRYSDAEADIDYDAYMDDPNYTTFSRQWDNKVQWQTELSDSWQHSLSGTVTTIERRLQDYTDPANPFLTDDTYRGDTRKIDWQHTLSMVERHVQVLGVEYEAERGTFDSRGSFPSRIDRVDTDTRAFYAQDQWQIGQDWSLLGGVRFDDHDRFGSEPTGKLSTVYALTPLASRLKANLATGFKAPSLYQLFSSYGDARLQPEKSVGFDAGYEQDFCGTQGSWSATYFYNRFKNLLDFDLNSFTYKNVGRAVTEGMELESRWQVAEPVTLRGNYTYLQTEDRVSGLELARRPVHTLFGAVDWAYNSRGNLQTRLNYVGRRWDDQPNTIRMGGYYTVDVHASYALTDQWTCFGSVINVFDRDYENIRGYNTLPLSAYAGVRGDF